MQVRAFERYIPLILITERKYITITESFIYRNATVRQINIDCFDFFNI